MQWRCQGFGKHVDLLHSCKLQIISETCKTLKEWSSKSDNKSSLWGSESESRNSFVIFGTERESCWETSLLLFKLGSKTSEGNSLCVESDLILDQRSLIVQESACDLQTGWLEAWADSKSICFPPAWRYVTNWRARIVFAILSSCWSVIMRWIDEAQFKLQKECTVWVLHHGVRLDSGKSTADIRPQSVKRWLGDFCQIQVRWSNYSKSDGLAQETILQAKRSLGMTCSQRLWISHVN